MIGVEALLTQKRVMIHLKRVFCFLGVLLNDFDMFLYEVKIREGG